jgi:prepilin-type N-terminal cleavage/methylation domain-containing protein
MTQDFGPRTAAPRRARLSSAAGMTLIELIMVVGIIGVALSFAMGITAYAVRQARADGAHAAAGAAIELARTRSVSERRDFQLEFVGNNRIQVKRIEPDATTTLIYDTFLENGQQFYKFTDGPTAMNNTPDIFPLVSSTSAINFGSTTARFTSDGSLIDASGDVMNGTLFIAAPPDKQTARAITVFGSTGLIHSWKWNGSAWVE